MDDVDVAWHLVNRLGGRTVATAESCTAGRIAESLACVEHASEFLRGGLIAYQTSVKRDLLGVTAPSVLSSEAAEEMVLGACRLLDADVGVSTTGVAGDEPEEGVPPGTVFIATCVDGVVSSRRHRFDGEPATVCDLARGQALRDLLAALTTVEERSLLEDTVRSTT